MNVWVPAAGIGIGIVAIGGLALASRRRRRPKKKPHMLCPSAAGKSAPKRPEDLGPGDFVALTFASGDEKVKATTWALVLRLPEDKADLRMWVRLVGETTTAGPVPLPKEVGKTLGDTLVADWSCVWDFYRAAHGKGLVLCGNFGEQVSGKKPALVEPTPLMDVQIYLALADANNPQLPGPGWDVPDPVWARVLSVSLGGSVVRVRIVTEPRIPEGATEPIHGMKVGDELDITRDCIFDFREAE